MKTVLKNTEKEFRIPEWENYFHII
jgi:hypothetical protein